MNIFELLKKVEDSPEFKEFKSKNKNAYFSAAFFVIDYESHESKKQLDYYISSKDVGTFTLNGDDVKFSKSELPKEEKISPIKREDIKFDEEKAVEISKEESSIGKFKKIIAVLQNLDGKNIWNLSCFNGLQMMRYHISAETGEVLKKEKINLMDIMKITSRKKQNPPDYTP